MLVRALLSGNCISDMHDTAIRWRDITRTRSCKVSFKRPISHTADSFVSPSWTNCSCGGRNVRVEFPPPLIQLVYGLSHLDVLPGSLLGNQVCYYRNCLLPKHAPWYCSCFKSAFSNAVLLRHAAKPLLLLHLLIVTSFAGRGAFFSLLSNFLSSSHNLSSQALVYRLRKELDDARMRDKRRPLLIYRIST